MKEKAGEWLSQKTCPVCGKKFTVLYPEMWAYRDRSVSYGRFLCSWKCLRADEKKGKTMKISGEQKKEAVRIATEGGRVLDYLKECGSTNPAGVWYQIKKTLKAEDPEAYGRLPEKYKPREERKAGKDAGKAETRTAEAVNRAEDGTDVVTDAATEEEPGRFYYDERTQTLEYGRKPEAGKYEAWQRWPPVATCCARSTAEGAEVPEELPEEAPEENGAMEWRELLITAVRDRVLGEFHWDEKYRTLDWRTPEGDEVSLWPEKWQRLLGILPDVMTVLGVRGK